MKIQGSLRWNLSHLNKKRSERLETCRFGKREKSHYQYYVISPILEG